MKKTYRLMVIEPLSIRFGSSILTASPTTTNIKVSTVKVEEFDAGFDFGSEHYDFQDLSFD